MSGFDNKRGYSSCYVSWSQGPTCQVLGALAKLQKLTTTYVISVCPSVRMEQLCSHWTDFHSIWYLCIFRKTVEKIQVSLQSANNNRYFTWRPIYIFDHISLSSSENEKCFRQKLERKSKHTFCVQWLFFRKSCRFMR